MFCPTETASVKFARDKKIALKILECASKNKTFFSNKFVTSFHSIVSFFNLATSHDFKKKIIWQQCTISRNSFYERVKILSLLSLVKSSYVSFWLSCLLK